MNTTLAVSTIGGFGIAVAILAIAVVIYLLTRGNAQGPQGPTGTGGSKGGNYPSREDINT